jgi:CRP-like cAMP-binding protein
MNNMMTNIEVAKIMVSGMKCMLSREQIHELTDILVCRKFKKGERILDEGEVCRSMLYLEKGLTRQFYFKYDKDLTEHIAYEGGVVICLESYLKEEPTRLMIETLEPTIAWDIPKDKIEELALKDAEIGVWYRKLFEASLIESQVKADTLRFEPAHERYNKLLQLHPEILKRAPLVYIASLLQMTPETLSRVRSASLNG